MDGVASTMGAARAAATWRAKTNAWREKKTAGEHPGEEQMQAFLRGTHECIQHLPSQKAEIVRASAAQKINWDTLTNEPLDAPGPPLPEAILVRRAPRAAVLALR